MQYLLKLLCLSLTIIGTVAAGSYPFVQQYFIEMPARVFRVNLINHTNLGGESRVEANITEVGWAKVPAFQEGRMQAKPPTSTYLYTISGGKTTYVAVFWRSGENLESSAHID